MLTKKEDIIENQREGALDKSIQYLNTYGRNKAKLDEMIKEAPTLFKVLREVAEKDSLTEDSVRNLKELQTKIGGYQQCLSQMEEGEALELSAFLEKVPLYKGTLTSLTGDLKNSVQKKLAKMNKHADELFKRWYAERIVAEKSEADVQSLVFKFNESSRNYLKFTDSIILDILKASLKGISNYFLSSYGHAVHSLASFRDDKIETAYLKANSPMEVRVASESLERKLSGIISNERAIVEDFLGEFPLNTTTTANAANISRRQKKKFLDVGLTPSVNALYKEMQLVSSSGMKYFDLRRELRADVMYLERSVGLVQRVGNRIKDNTKKEFPTTNEVKELLEISTHQNYFLLHKELEGMIFVGREAKRYNELYSQVISEAKELLLKIDDDIRKNGKVIETVIEPEKKYEKAVGINNNPSQPQRAQEIIPPVQEAISPQTAAQRPKLEVISGCAVVKTSPRAEKAGAQARILETKADASPYIPSTTSAYDITSKLDDITEPENPALKAFYNLLHRRDVHGRFIIAYPAEIVQMFGDIKLQEEGKYSSRYTETDKSFIRTVMGYLNNPDTLMYGEIKGSDVIKSAPRLMHDALMIIR